MKQILWIIGILWSLVYPSKLKTKFKLACSLINASYLSRSLKKIGRNSFIAPNVIVQNPQYISIGEHFRIQEGSILTAISQYANCKFSPLINIGNNVSIGWYNHITSINEINIGDNVLIGSYVTITDNSHGKTFGEDLNQSPEKRHLHSKGKVIIQNNVWIGDKVTILPNITIGEGAIIGANSVVAQDIPPKAIAVGNPIKILIK